MMQMCGGNFKEIKNVFKASKQAQPWNVSHEQEERKKTFQNQWCVSDLWDNNSKQSGSPENNRLQRKQSKEIMLCSLSLVKTLLQNLKIPTNFEYREK